ncbi:MAG: SGNH/GDSL hydrolase family protein [Oscillospiraceae bacterium]|nr:SGNH/GDSL hydrolase family protein [Oscillospiraceae bacterium]
MRIAKRILTLLCACGMLLPYTGCRQNSSSHVTTNQMESAVSSAIVTEPSWTPADPTLNLPSLQLGYTTEEMCKRAMINTGNQARLANVMKKAADNKKVTIGCIGGSITQGSGAASSSENYAFYHVSWWVKQFPQNAALNFVNAGIGATGSYIGVHRAAEDLLSQKPDVVVVEFSVNDTDAAFNYKTYDSLIRKILQADNQPAVILLFMCQENNTTLAKTHMQIGEAYDLPMISYQNAVMPEIEKNTFLWSDIAVDHIHPNSNGHGIIGELLWNYYNSVYAQLDTIDTTLLTFDTESPTGDLYADAELLNASEIMPIANTGFQNQTVMYQFPDNWVANTEGASLTFEVEARNIGILYQRTIHGKSGQYEVYVDGTLTKTLDGDFKGGWGDYAEATEVFASDKKTKHKIEIKGKEGSTAYQFAVLGLLIS